MTAAALALAACEQGNLLSTGLGRAGGLELAAGGGVQVATPTGTEAGRNLRNAAVELAELQAIAAGQLGTLHALRTAAVLHAQDYYLTTAVLRTRLQRGDADPATTDQLKAAAGQQIELVAADIEKMRQLAGIVGQAQSKAATLKQNIIAAGRMPGAVGGDQAQMAILASEVDQMSAVFTRIATEVSSRIDRQTRALAEERSNLAALGLTVPAALTTVAAAPTSGLRALPTTPTAAALDGGLRPLVVIRFDSNNVEYEQALYQAVQAALQRRPDANFDLVAMSPNANDSAAERARAGAARVYSSLTAMGLPADRVAVTARSHPAIASSEVHLYVH